MNSKSETINRSLFRKKIPLLLIDLEKITTDLPQSIEFPLKTDVDAVFQEQLIKSKSLMLLYLNGSKFVISLINKSQERCQLDA